MLSRVADSLYWMSRYLERAEHSARLVNVHLNLMLDTGGQHSERRWTTVMESLGLTPPEGAAKDAGAASNFLTFDLENRSSIVSCIMIARENARQVREQISSEMWEQLNRLFHAVRRAGVMEDWNSEPLEFLSAVKEGSYLFCGLADTTMNHGEGWQFIQLGRYLERSLSLATLLDVHFQELLGDGENTADPGDHLEWIGLLRSCTAFEAYCKVYTADLRPERIAEFLTMSPQFPHSLRFSIDRVQRALGKIQQQPLIHAPDQLERLIGRLQSSLQFTRIDEILDGGLHTYLDGVRRQCGQIHSTIHQVYITYPIEAALGV